MGHQGLQSQDLSQSPLLWERFPKSLISHFSFPFLWGLGPGCTSPSPRLGTYGSLFQEGCLSQWIPLPSNPEQMSPHRNASFLETHCTHLYGNTTSHVKIISLRDYSMSLSILASFEGKDYDLLILALLPDWLVIGTFDKCQLNKSLMV